MRQLLALTAILLTACVQPSNGAGGQPSVSCEVLLQQIQQLPVKSSWSLCNTAAPPEIDYAHCKLIDPSPPKIDSCLISVITNVAPVPDPRAPRMMDTIALGDLAFFVLNDRYPDLWGKVLPPGTDGTPTGYFKIMAEPGMRQELQRKVREALPPNNSFKPTPLRGAA